MPLHTFGDVDGTLYFVMGYVRGESLAARIKREGRLPADATRRLLAEIADALDYAHRLGIVHRDVKPDNVLIEEGTGRALLTDFGVAKALGAGQTVTATGSILGTPQYMSPEQAQGMAELDGRSDIYSLGVMGFAMLAGRLPFVGETPAAVMLQHITKEAPLLSALAPDAPADLSAAIGRCLAKKPEARWSDAGALKAALVEADAGELPIQFEGLRSFVYLAVLHGLGLLYSAAWWAGARDFPGPAMLMPFFSGIGLVATVSILAVKVLLLRRGGFGWPQILRTTLEQPQVWAGWYPRRLRASGDVWDRLPKDLQRTRSLLGWAMVAGTLLLVPNMWMVIGSEWRWSQSQRYSFPRPLRDAISNTAMSTVFVPGVASLIFLRRWNRLARERLPDAERNHAVAASTGRRSFWSRPEVAALLLPALVSRSSASEAATTPVEISNLPTLPR